MIYRAFVSSTYEDLKEHRRHVIRSLRKAGITVDPMEDWTADTDEPKVFSQERVAGCHLCILLVGLRRGYVPDGESLSITQLEYQAAIASGIDVLVFMLDERRRGIATSTNVNPIPRSRAGARSSRSATAPGNSAWNRHPLT